MVIGFMMLRQALLLGVARVQILERHAFTHLSGGDYSRAFGQAKQKGFLFVDLGFVGGNVGLERSHLGRIQGKPQTQLAFAERRFGFLQVGDIDDRAD